MPIPSYSDLIAPSSTANGLISESVEERLLSLMAMVACGKAPDGTAIPLGSGSAGTTGGIGIPVAAPTGVATTDSANIRSAISTANAAGGGWVILQNGNYAGDTSQFNIPQNVMVYLCQNTIWTLGCTAGASTPAIQINKGAGLVGQGFGGDSSAQITNNSAFNAKCHIQAGTAGTVQEYAYINGIHINVSSLTGLADSVINWTSIFVNSGIRDCVFACNGVNAGIPCIKIIGSTGTGGAWGPVYIEDTWVVNSGGDGIFATDNNGSSASAGSATLWLNNVTVEHPANNYHNFHFQGFGGFDSVNMNGIHTENNNATSVGPVAAVYFDGVGMALIDGISVLSGNITNKRCIWISNNGNNGGGGGGIKVRGLKNVNGMNPAIRDDTGFGLTIGAGTSIAEYNGPNFSSAYHGSLILGTGDVILGRQSIGLVTTAVNAQNGNIIEYAAIAAAATVAAPQNPQDGQTLRMIFVQNGTGGFTITWNAIFHGPISTTVATAANAVTIVDLIYMANVVSSAGWRMVNSIQTT